MTRAEVEHVARMLGMGTSIDDETVREVVAFAAAQATERDDWKAACLRARDMEEALQGVGPLADVAEAVAVEREACALEADREQERWRAMENIDVLEGDRWQHRQQANTARDIAAAIRARGTVAK